MLRTINLYNRVIQAVFTALLAVICISIFGGSRSLAVVGDPSNTLPNNGSSLPWAVVTRPGGNGMDAPSNKTQIYVPVGSDTDLPNVSFTINDACDNTGNDAQGQRNDTYFWFTASEVTSISTSSGGTAVAGPAPGWWSDYLARCDTGDDSALTVKLNSSAEKYTVNGITYRRFNILAQTHVGGSYDNYYANRFRYTFAPGVIVSYPSLFASTTVSSAYTGISYDNTRERSWGWSTRINFATKCGTPDTSAKQVYFLDTDHNATGEGIDPQWQTPVHPMSYTIEIYNRATGAYVGVATSGILTGGWQNEADFTNSFVMQSAYTYSINITNVNYVNSIQVAVPSPALQLYAYDRCIAGEPIGYADSCKLVGANTIIYGWAYDNDAASGDGRPTISVTANGATQTVNSSISGFRSAEVDGFLNVYYYGTSTARDGQYGWSATFSGLVQGGNYPLSGTINNVSPNGSNKALGINPGALPPGGDTSGTHGFPGGRIPNGCLPSTPPGITANCTAASSIVEPGGLYSPFITFTHSTPAALDATGSLTLTVRDQNNAILAGSGRTKASFTISKPAPATTRDTSVGVAGATYAFDAPNTAIAFPTPGNYTATYDWSWTTTAGQSGPPAPVAPVTTNDCLVTITVASRPYFKVLGGDIITHSSGTSVLGWNQGLGILALGYEATFPSNTNGRFGSSTQGMLLAAGATSGVASSSRNPGASAPRSLTLANTPPTPLGTYNNTWGGGFGNPYLMPAPVFTSQTGLPTINSVAGVGAASEYNLVGTTLTGGNFPAGKQATIYVAGNVRITSNITYVNANRFNSIDQVPRFRLVASGDIYVDPAVTQLDGEYIAGNGGNGSVYTCFASTWSAPLNGTTENPYGVCGGTLLVNGSLVGDSIKLTRVVGTLRAANNNDGNMNGLNTYRNSANISEIFQFTPELFLARPAGKPTDPAGNGYDSITALPPLF